MAVLAGFYLCLRFSPLPEMKLKKDYSTAFLASDGTLLRLTLSPSGKYRLPLELEQVSPQVTKGFIAYEDRWFWWHPGVNPISALRALALNLSRGKVLAGASTLTMQVAKLLDPRPRTYGSKLLETFRALQLEARYSKKQILAFYLNSVPMGGNIEGVGAASLLYFGKPAQSLSWGETALLISLPKSPYSRRPDRFPDRAREGRDKVLRQIIPALGLSPGEAREAFQAAVPQGRFVNPSPAPQLARRAAYLSGKPFGVIELTIKPELQGLAQHVLSAAVARLKIQGAHNGALMIVDNHTRQVLAYVGSPDFHDPHGGQINGANILRSPGSALKPFLYGLAIDQGVLTPKKILYDIPRDYGGYKPADYEGSYEGLVTAEEALSTSLNIPAVGLESQLEPLNGGLGQWIKRAGCVGRGRDQLDPGLSVALGAYPVSLEEMMSLYAALANGGEWKPLVFFKDGRDSGRGTGKALLSPEACFMVCEMLSQVERTDIPASWQFAPSLSKIAFKTGTSFGHRDAWCVGVTPDYTIGVWLGNADAQGVPALVGHDAAAPIVIDLFDQLTRTNDQWFKKPPGVQIRKVCALSGDPAGDDCPESIDDYFIPGVSDNQPCPIHRRVWLRKKDGLEVCHYCMTGKPQDYQSRVFEVWPPDVTRFLRSHGQKFEAIPAHNPACAYFNQGEKPRLTSPNPEGHYELVSGIPLEDQKLTLSVQAGPDVDQVYWFVNGDLVAQSKPDQLSFWQLRPGRWDVSVIDSRGRADKTSILVTPSKDSAAAH